MRFHKLDLNLLVALNALLVHKSVTTAAAQLNLSQSALSCALARLREHFEDELLVSVGRRMVMTPLAIQLEAPLRQLLTQAEDLVRVRPTFDPPISQRQFRLAGSDYLISTLMHEVIQKVSIAAPGLSISFYGPENANLQELENGELDFIITAAASSEPPPGMRRQKLFEDRFVCLVATHNEQACRNISLQKYLKMKHVVYKRDVRGGDGFEHDHLLALGHTRRIAASCPTFKVIPESLVGTDFIATVPERLARRAIESMPLNIVEPPIEFPLFSEDLIWPRHADGDAGLRWMGGQLIDAAHALGEARSAGQQKLTAVSPLRARHAPT